MSSAFSPNRLIALLVGLAAGVGLGLLYSWVIDPVQYVDTTPDSLAAPYKAEFALTIAEAYARDNDLAQARAGLVELGFAAPAGDLSELVEDRAAGSAPAAELQYLAALARDLGGDARRLEPYLP